MRSKIAAWRTGSAEGQWAVVLLLVIGMGASLAVSLVHREWMPLSAYWLWLVAAMLLLRFGPLLTVAAIDLVMATASIVLTHAVSSLRVLSLVEFAVAAGLLLSVAARQRTGLPTLLSGNILGELKDRLAVQSRMPALPSGWETQSAMVAAHGSHYAGDFLVSRLDEDERTLEVILVDVCGRGAAAASTAIHFAGALGGLIGALPPDRLFAAANDFLIRQSEDEGYATAVHIKLSLDDGSYLITSAGHPPVLRWDLPKSEWVLDNARGTALGLLAVPELHQSPGRLFPGEGLLFYTDGVVGTGSSLDAGISWLQGVARDAVGGGFGGAARRIISHVDSGEDDRAVLIVSRGKVPPSDADTKVRANPASGAGAASSRSLAV